MRRIPDITPVAPVTLDAVKIGERVVYLPPDAVVHNDTVAGIFGVSERTVERWPIVRSYVSPQRPCMLWSDVIAYVKQQRAA